MSSQRTEKPTPGRLKKAREQGNFPSARELVGALQFLLIVLIAGRCAAGWLEAAKVWLREGLAGSFTTPGDETSLMHYGRRLLMSAFLPLAASAGLVLSFTLAAQLASTGMGVSLHRLAPDLVRLSPLRRLREIPKQNVPAALQASAVLCVLSWMVWTAVRENAAMLLALPLGSVEAGLGQLASATDGLLWRVALILLALGSLEAARQRAAWNRSMRMTRQEVREEARESEGDPHIKARIRRLRRDLLRRRMMQDVPTATAVIMNPTHYAVAIRYESGTMASPKVVAKGRDHLALRIRKTALDHGVTIVENPPLARALYQSVEVGREIPPDFYRAVAEVLAWVYRVRGQGQR